MREIKFRAYNTRRKEMEYFIDLYWFEENQVHESGDNDYIILEYTGLKDKNGKEIYEGDIDKKCGVVKYGSYEPVFGRGFDSFIPAVESVITSYFRFRDENNLALSTAIINHLKNSYGSVCHGWYCEKSNRRYGINDRNVKEFEIIGNIYENPELLEAEK